VVGVLNAVCWHSKFVVAMRSRNNLSETVLQLVTTEPTRANSRTIFKFRGSWSSWCLWCDMIVAKMDRDTLVFHDIPTNTSFTEHVGYLFDAQGQPEGHLSLLCHNEALFVSWGNRVLMFT
jgi:hypothetical protein